jgi:hypothetical protein
VFPEFELEKLWKMHSNIVIQGQKWKLGVGGGKSHREEKLSNTGLMDRPGSPAHLDCSTLNSVSLQTRVCIHIQHFAIYYFIIVAAEWQPKPDTMGRMHSSGSVLLISIFYFFFLFNCIFLWHNSFSILFDCSKGISSSALPYKRTSPSWLKISSQDVSN